MLAAKSLQIRLALIAFSSRCADTYLELGQGNRPFRGGFARAGMSGMAPVAEASERPAMIWMKRRREKCVFFE